MTWPPTWAVADQTTGRSDVLAERRQGVAQPRVIPAPGEVPFEAPAQRAVLALDAPSAKNNFGAALGEQTRSRLADPTACSGDRYDFSLDAGHRRPFVPVPPPRIPPTARQIRRKRLLSPLC